MSVREQLFTLLRDLRWIIVLSLFLSVVLAVAFLAIRGLNLGDGPVRHHADPAPATLRIVGALEGA